MIAPPDPAFLDAHVTRGLEDESGRHCAKLVLGDHVPKPGDVVMQSNDYLALANDRRIAEAKAKALLHYGHGDAISRVFAHHRDDPHRRFEQRIAKLTQGEDAALVMSGYNANVGLIEAFAAPGSPVYLDIRAHASLWSGVSCGRAAAVPFRHNNADDLKRKIAQSGPGLVVIDSLYSTNGKIAPLADIISVAEDGGCVIVVDETHSFGTHGPDGAGLVVAEGLAEKVHFRTVGLSKAMAARGGVVIGSARNIEFYRYEALSMIFSTSVLGYEIAGFDKTLDIIAEEPERTKRLHSNHAYLRDGLAAEGFEVGESDSQIIALVTGANSATKAFRDALAKRGVFGSVFLPPATPKNKSLIRFTVNAGLYREDLDRTIAACAEARDELGLKPGASPCLAEAA
ncbi:MAG: alpha-hydroxyketone-type quorum-sensing autoinducer synthase [Pseudomonadota bacterium]